MNAGFGNKVHTETKADNFDLFMRANRLTLVVIAWCAAMMLALYQPFIKIWTGGNPDLVRHALTPLLMVAYFCVNQSRQPLLTFKGAASIWREDRWKPIVAGSANLAMNISFVLFLPDEYKLDGVILSTILSCIIIQMPWEAHVVFTVFFNREQGRRYWLAQLRFATSAIAMGALTWGAVHAIPLAGPVGFVIDGSVAMLVAGCLAICLFRRDMAAIFGCLRSQARCDSTGK